MRSYATKEADYDAKQKITVLCVDLNGCSSLTKGKLYEAVNEAEEYDTNYYQLVNDKGSTELYDKACFVVVGVSSCRQQILTLYTNGKDVLRISKYVPPTDSIQGYFILARDDKGCEVTLKDFLTKWKVFNSAAAFADYLLYIDKLLTDCRDTDFHNTIKHMMQWVKNRSTDAGITWSTPIKLEDLEIYGVDINEYLLEINKRILGDNT